MVEMKQVHYCLTCDNGGCPHDSYLIALTFQDVEFIEKIKKKTFNILRHHVIIDLF